GPGDGGGRGRGGEPGCGCPIARRTPAAERRPKGTDPTRLGDRCRTLRRVTAGDGDPGARLGLTRQQSAHPDERGDRRSLSAGVRLAVTGLAPLSPLSRRGAEGGDPARRAG